MDGLLSDMYRDITGRGVESERALKALRAFSNWYGGQQVYIPQRKEESSVAKEIRGVMADAVGDADADKIYAILSSLYGGVQWYIPLERNAFRTAIAQEVLNQYDGTIETMRRLCRQYGCSFGWIYRLYHEALEAQRQREFIF